MGKYFIWGVLVCALMISCKDGAKNADFEAGDANGNSESFKRVIADGAYNFQVEYNGRLDTSYLDIIYKGKKTERQGFKGKVIGEFTGDLNRDKANEIYIVTGNENAPLLTGFLLENGISTKITKKDPKIQSRITAPKYSVERNQLVEKFQMATPDGAIGYGEYRYNLVEMEDGLALLPQGWQSFELNARAGEYVTKPSKSTGYYNVMTLGKRAGGKWKVEIQVKRSSNKEVVCSFTGLGEFDNKDLYVPLNQGNAELEGTLQIRFINAMAVVYTEKTEDSREMAEFCKGKGSIAGNFNKTDNE